MSRRLLHYAAVAGAAGVILGIGAMGSPPTGAPRGVPLLRLDKTIERLAPAPPGTDVTTRFTLHNDGTGPLRLSYLQSSCGCVEARLSRSEVPPGKSALLEAEVLFPKAGRRESRIEFFTNSAARGPVTLTVIAESDVPVPYVTNESDPGAVFNGWLSPGTCRTAVVRTIEQTGSAPWLRHFETDLLCVSVQLVHVEESPSADQPAEIEREYRLELSLSEVPTSRLEGRLMAFADEEDVAAVLGPVLVDSADPIELYPSALYLTAEAAETPRTVYVRSVQPNFELECAVQQPLPDRVEVRPGKQDRAMQAFLISLTDAAPQAAAGGRARWEIVFLTNHPEIRRISLPVVLRR